eukprot:Seg293.5 transcript_id=Seg293.5/GoldUCD/mRNA.D3Y31 product="NEDD4 family-interacting protein 1" protein_id=Seg293.5/GoldUCD/D3Y31
MSASSQTLESQDPSGVNDGLTDDEAPPPYSAVNTDTQQGDTDPPAYNEVIKLPSYGEVVAMHRVNAIREYFNLSDDDLEEDCVTDPPIIPENSGLVTHECAIGTDQHFVVCFLLSFILNWIGFLIGFCLGSSLAAHHGALCGFGLSLIKWALVIQTSKCWDVSVNQPWVIWVFILIGLVIFIKGAIDYIHLKRNRRERHFLYL